MSDTKRWEKPSRHKLWQERNADEKAEWKSSADARPALFVDLGELPDDDLGCQNVGRIAAVDCRCGFAMSELRQDRTTGRSVIIAPQRRLRPGAQERRVNAEPLARPRFDPGCPFCPGNEASLPGIIAEIPIDGPPH